MAGQFMLLLRNTDAAWTSLSPDEMQHVMERYMAWSGELRAAGHEVLSAESLDQRTSVTLTRSGADFTVEDGPYAETKEGIGGYYLITARDRAEAVAAARGCPVFLHGGRVDIVRVDTPG